MLTKGIHSGKSNLRLAAAHVLSQRTRIFPKYFFNIEQKRSKNASSPKVRVLTKGIHSGKLNLRIAATHVLSHRTRIFYKTLFSKTERK